MTAAAHDDRSTQVEPAAGAPVDRPVMALVANADVTVKESCLDPLTLRVTMGRIHPIDKQTGAHNMNAYATIEFLSNTTNNGRTVRRALVELSDAKGQWLGFFTVFGFTTQEIKDRAYMEADINLTHKGYTLQTLREAA